MVFSEEETEARKLLTGGNLMVTFASETEKCWSPSARFGSQKQKRLKKGRNYNIELVSLLDSTTWTNSAFLKVWCVHKSLDILLKCRLLHIRSGMGLALCCSNKQWKQWETLFSWSPKSLQTVTAAMKLKNACSLEESYDQSRHHIKKQRHYFTNKSLSSQSYGFSSSHVWMWELDYKESWVPKNWCFLTVVLNKTLESPLDSKEIQQVYPKGNQSWIFIERTDAEAETLIF